MNEALFNARKSRKMTQSQVATLAGLHQAAYCNIENGKRKPSVALAKKIAVVLGIDWFDIF